MNVKKASGHDERSIKMLKICSPVLAEPLTDLINCSLDEYTFPDNMKIAQVVPIHKKNSLMDKSNYRPVSLLPVMSKVFERAIYVQLMDHFERLFNPYLNAFRPGLGCNTALLKVVEDWKIHLDDNKYLAAILMDLSKAFDCLPHDLLLLKLEHYGLTSSATNLIKSYLSNRKQCVKVGKTCGDFQEIIKGVPQGSILGPVLFNIFINDIFHFVQKSKLYNYADDNTLSNASCSIPDLVRTLEEDSLSLIKWFSINQMKANPENFQAMTLGHKTHKNNLNFKFNGIVIQSEDEVKLLGVNLDFLLSFNSHIRSMCRKASKQLNVLKRLGKYLNKLGRLTIYYSFSMSNFNYCPLTLHFTNETNTKKIEKIQEHALRFIYEDHASSYEQLLKKSGLPSLKVRRLRSIAAETFKILHQISPEYLYSLITYKDSYYNFRNKNTIEIPQPRTERYGRRSFRYTVAVLWNSLPSHFRETSSFIQFRNLINSWEGEICHCSACHK